jgi:hypothetical protein
MNTHTVNHSELPLYARDTINKNDQIIAFPQCGAIECPFAVLLCLATLNSFSGRNFY